MSLVQCLHSKNGQIILGPNGGGLEIPGTCFRWRLGAIKDCAGACRTVERLGVQEALPV